MAYFGELGCFCFIVSGTVILVSYNKSASKIKCGVLGWDE